MCFNVDDDVLVCVFYVHASEKWVNQAKQHKTKNIIFFPGKENKQHIQTLITSLRMKGELSKHILQVLPNITLDKQ